jgi:hypothetical protein
MGAWSGASDDYDPPNDTELITTGSIGYAGVYHEKGVDGWTAPSMFLFNDIRSPLAPDEGRTWSPICVWADLSYTSEQMAFSMEADAATPPLPNRRDMLELIAVPEGVVGAPLVGSEWALPRDELFTLVLPAYLTDKGLTGFRFAFSVYPVPEPASGGRS